MRRFVVLAEPLAVIGGDDDQGVVAQTQLLDLRDDEADLVVDPRNLGVVRTLRDLRSEARGRNVRVMRVEVVEPEEEPLVRVPTDELDAPAADVRACSMKSMVR